MENSIRSPAQDLILFLAALGVTESVGGGSGRRGGCGAGRKKKKSTSVDFTFQVGSLLLTSDFIPLTEHWLCSGWAQGHEQKDRLPGKQW